MDNFLAKPRFLFLVLLTFASMLNIFSWTKSLCIENERKALLVFKQDITDTSNRLSSWSSVENECCKWVGVICDSTTGYVKELHLQNPLSLETRVEFEAFSRTQLKGNINPSLVELKQLRFLDLSYNDFGGIQIPSFLASLKSLRHLNLTEAGFKGLIPHQLGNLSNLLQLTIRGPDAYLEEASLYVDHLHWLNGLSSLVHLDMSHVNLSLASDWLIVINKLPSLLELHLSECSLQSFPSLSSVNFTHLSVLDLSWNQFSSQIPKWILGLSSLTSLDLRANNIEGPIPSDYWNLTSLESLDVSLNYLNSSLPNGLFSLNSLVSLVLRANSFEGPIPIGLKNMTILKKLDISENDFNSSLPDWLFNMKSLQNLDLHSLDLQGRIPSTIKNSSSLTSLDISFSKLDGEIPRQMGDLCNLKWISLEGNKLGGSLSETFLRLSGCLSNSLESLELSGNNISGNLTDEITKFKHLRYLNIAANFISGQIPSSIGSLSSLERLYIRGNQLTGTLPESIGNLSELMEIDFSYNMLEGILTEVHFQNLTKLKRLIVSNDQLWFKVNPTWIPPFRINEFEARNVNLGPSFPLWLQSQDYFSSLDLSSAGISDTIPSWFWNLTSRTLYLNISHNKIKGEFPADLVINSQFTLIYLS